ncbi:hypothetical protein K8R62_00915, partial [bacterium]|nr:hypothetical protein [bacterium]
NKIFELIIEADEGRKKELSQSQLDKLLSRIVKIHPPAKAKGIKPPYIYKINQLKSNPPLFNVKIGPKDTLHFSYVNFIKNQLKSKFKFYASPINIKIKID